MYHFELKNPSLKWEKELEKFFDVFSNNEHSFAPACEIIDEEKFYSISLDVPGMREDEIDIEVKDNHLHVSGERKTEKNNVLRSEKRYGKFSRMFSLPQNVNFEEISAHFRSGVLELTLPKEEKSQTRKIQISNAKKEAAALKS
jgi:HSP20 family protein